MAATKPNRGPVASIGTNVIKREKKARPRNGRWRPDLNYDGDGIKITMRREKGVTKGDVLRVPFRFQTPVLGELSRPYRFNWATYETLRLGQRSRPSGEQLLEVAIDTMLLDGPAADSSTGVVVWKGPEDPQAMIRELRWIMGKGPGAEPQVFRLVISQPSVWGSEALVNMLAVLTSVEPRQKADEVGTEYLSCTFLEYREDTIGRKQRPQAHGRKRHRLRQGDTLYEIAKKSHFHQASAWKKIAKANGIKGVSPGDAGELAKWAKKHHKNELVIPAKGGD